MFSENAVFLTGNLGKDPELRFTPAGTDVLDVSLACSDRYKDKSGEWKETVDWINVQAWGKTAEYVGTNAKKGDTLIVRGKIKTQSWLTPDGNKRYKTFVNATRIDVVPRGQKSADGGDDDIPF